MKIRHLSLLLKCSTQRTCPAGELLFQEGDPVTGFFLIKSGALVLHRGTTGDKAVVRTAQSGEVFGWSCVFPHATWTLGGRTLGPTTVTVLDGGGLLAAADEDPEFGRELWKRASKMEAEAVQPALLPVHIWPLEAGVFQSEGGTITGNSPFFSNDALDLSPENAEQLSLQEGQWVQLADRHGATILPVHIKPTRREAGRAIEQISSAMLRGSGEQI